MLSLIVHVDETMSEIEIDECPVCFGTVSLPYKLECGHVFCYLCVKQAVTTNPACPVCGDDVSPQTIIEGAVDQDGDLTPPSTATWAYAGRTTGWWYFDPESSSLIEGAWAAGDDIVVINIAGIEYTIDFATGMQTSSETGLSREVKRMVGAEGVEDVKGVAGLAFRYSLQEVSQT